MAEGTINHGLIMFIGVPGSGKSTLSTELYRQLKQRGISASLLPEEDVYQLDVLQSFTAQWQRSDPAGVDTLLTAITTLRDRWRASDTVWITDQFLPAFHWLPGKYPVEQVEEYADRLTEILQPLRPLVVSLQVDITKA